MNDKILELAVTIDARDTATMLSDRRIRLWL